MVDSKDQVIGKSLIQNGEWAVNELSMVLSCINKSAHVLIVGAHIGTLAIPIAKCAEKIVAIEANPDTFELLKTNIRLNDLHNFEAHCVAANDRYEELCFLANTDNSGGSKRKPLKMDYMYVYDDPSEIVVQAVALDIFLPEQFFDVVVMDIEGSEYHALKGMPRILDTAGVLVIEFVPHHIRNVSGVSIEDFVGLLVCFDRLYWPSRNITVPSECFLPVLKYLSEKNITEDGLVFFKTFSSNA